LVLTSDAERGEDLIDLAPEHDLRGGSTGPATNLPSFEPRPCPLASCGKQAKANMALRRLGTEVATFTLSAVTAVRAHAPKSVSFARQVDQILAAFDTWIGGKPQHKNRH
jgi:hypothetical protein